MSSFSTRDEQDSLIVTLSDSASMNDFRSNTFRNSLYEVVENRETPRIALDMGVVDYLSSSGVAILVGMKRRCDAKHGKFVIYGIQPNVFDLLRVMRLDQYFTFASDESEALASLRPLPTA